MIDSRLPSPWFRLSYIRKRPSDIGYIHLVYAEHRLSLMPVSIPPLSDILQEITPMTQEEAIQVADLSTTA
jgi:hypothetical protein